MSVLTGSIRLSAEGPLDPDAVWRRYTEPARWNTWAPHLSEVDYPHKRVRAGTTGRASGPGGVVALFRVESVDPDARTWSWSVRTGPLRLSFDHGVDEVGADSRAWVVIHAPWPVAIGYAPVARWALEKLVTP
jgi:hypothetical protein